MPHYPSSDGRCATGSSSLPRQKPHVIRDGARPRIATVREKLFPRIANFGTQVSVALVCGYSRQTSDKGIAESESERGFPKPRSDSSLASAEAIHILGPSPFHFESFDFHSQPPRSTNDGRGVAHASSVLRPASSRAHLADGRSQAFPARRSRLEAGTSTLEA